jgi:glycosyltransferase involved in cell wall biosynthesis
MNKREMDLIKKYDTPETVCLVTSYPDRHGESAERNAIANYSRELVREMGKKTPVVVISEVLDMPKIYEEDGVLVMRVFERDSLVMNFQIVKAIKRFVLANQVVLQFEFGVYGGSITTFLVSLLGFMVKMTGKKFSVMMHQVTDDLGELSEHLGIAPKGIKTLTYNLGMRTFYALTGLWSDIILVHNSYLAKKLSRYVYKKKILVVPHGVGVAGKTPTYKQSREDLGWKSDEFVILVFGYLSWYKGSDWVVEEIGKIIKKYPTKKINLVMAGGESGTLKEMKHYRQFVGKLYDLAIMYGAEITGYVHDNDKAKYFVGCDLVVLPHRVAMSESGVMAHVAMYARPFLASMPRTTSLHNPELVKQIGFTWGKGSLEKKLIKMIKDKELRASVSRTIGKQGRAHSWGNVAEQYLVALPKTGNERYTGAKYDTQVVV